MLPTASSVVDHSPLTAMTVVTASGGAWKPLPPAMAVEICRYLMKPSVAMTANRIASIWIMRLFTTWTPGGRRRHAGRGGRWIATAHLDAAVPREDTRIRAGIGGLHDERGRIGARRP